ncbi:unnamed protein product, partial [Symbiodinium pilosum]
MACVLHAPVTKRTSMSLSYAAKHLIMLTVSSSDPRLTAWFVCLGKKGQQQLHSVLFSLSRRGALMCGFATHFHVRTTCCGHGHGRDGTVFHGVALERLQLQTVMRERTRLPLLESLHDVSEVAVKTWRRASKDQ